VRCRKCAQRFEDYVLEPGQTTVTGEIWEDGNGQRWIGGEDTTVVAVPQVLKYLDVELAAMGIKLTYKVEP
jgi:DNA-directed RNA polymerase I subunit RPA2